MTSSTHHQSVASTHDRRHADSQTFPQNPGQLYPCCKAIYRFPRAIARYGQRRQFTPLSVYLVDHGISPISLNATLTGLKFLFATRLDHSQLLTKMHAVHVPHKLPTVLSREEVAHLFVAVDNIKRQTALAVAYGAGLRVSQVVSLKVRDPSTGSGQASIASA
ncbi:MAG: hypothetical protein ACXW1Z_22235 [Methylobacter sp.]